MHRRIVLLLVAPLLVVAACGGDDVAVDETTTTSSTAAPSTTEAGDDPVDGAGVTVELLDPGAEPRTELRYRAPEGTVDRVVQVQEIDIVQDVDGRVQDLPIPTNEIDLTATVVATGDDERTIDAVFEAFRVQDDPSIPPEVVAETSRLFDLIAGLTQTTVQTPQGFVLSTTVADLAVTDNAFVDQFLTQIGEQAQSLALPFPAEPVGVGATWRVTTDLVLSGLPIIGTYELAIDSIEGDVVTATAATTVTFTPGDVDVMGQPATVVSGELTGGGTVSWDLATQVLPRSDLDASGTVVLGIGGLTLTQDQTQRTVIRSAG